MASTLRDFAGAKQIDKGFVRASTLRDFANAKLDYRCVR